MAGHYPSRFCWWAASPSIAPGLRHGNCSLHSREDVRSALEAGFAAATILPSSNAREMRDELRIAFDGTPLAVFR